MKIINAIPRNESMKFLHTLLLFRYGQWPLHVYVVFPDGRVFSETVLFDPATAETLSMEGGASVVRMLVRFRGSLLSLHYTDSEESCRKLFEQKLPLVLHFGSPQNRFLAGNHPHG